MKKVILYMHGGSGNRGCEAIVRSTLALLGCAKEHVTVLSHSIIEDREAGLEKICELLPGKNKSVEQLNLLQRGLANIYNRLFHSELMYFKMMYKLFEQTDFHEAVALSIGGDNYCYNGSEQDLAWHNRIVKERGGTSVLWGCSVEPSLLTKRVVADLKSYDLITARESITYNALKQVGVEKVYLYPDAAFTLERRQNDCSNLLGNNVVGVNMSPYVINSASNSQIGLDNYSELIRWILDNTDMSVALIPHVMKPYNNDMLIMEELYKRYVHTGRVLKIDRRLNCMEFKDLIARCRFFVGARTHATIAAYSSCVPTLVVGYSIKAKGIAQDLFGTFENYVIPAQSLKRPHDLTSAFRWIMKHEDEIRKHLQEFIPGYSAKVLEAGKIIKQMMRESL